MDRSLGPLSGCGESCGLCANYLGERQPTCPGCEAAKGHPFWGECKTYTCLSSRNIDHCGNCGNFPCEEFISHFDPNNPEGQRNAVVRAGILAYRARHGDEKTQKLIEKLGKPPRAK